MNETVDPMSGKMGHAVTKWTTPGSKIKVLIIILQCCGRSLLMHLAFVLS